MMMVVHFPLLVNYTVENMGRKFPMWKRGTEQIIQNKQLKAEDESLSRRLREKKNVRQAQDIWLSLESESKLWKHLNLPWCQLEIMTFYLLPQ